MSGAVAVLAAVKVTAFSVTIEEIEASEREAPASPLVLTIIPVVFLAGSERAAIFNCSEEIILLVEALYDTKSVRRSITLRLSSARVNRLQSDSVITRSFSSADE